MHSLSTRVIYTSGPNGLEPGFKNSLNYTYLALKECGNVIPNVFDMGTLVYGKCPRSFPYRDNIDVNDVIYAKHCMIMSCWGPLNVMLHILDGDNGV